MKFRKRMLIAMMAFALAILCALFGCSSSSTQKSSGSASAASATASSQYTVNTTKNFCGITYDANTQWKYVKLVDTLYGDAYYVDAKENMFQFLVYGDNVCADDESLGSGCGLVEGLSCDNSSAQDRDGVAFRSGTVKNKHVLVGYDEETGMGCVVMLIVKDDEISDDLSKLRDLVFESIKFDPKIAAASYKPTTTSQSSQSSSSAAAETTQTNTPTVSQSNALKMAKQYLGTMPFSHDGLIEQLKYEGFSDEDAAYGVDNCGADWNKQAEKMAKQYLDTMAFSHDGLVEQLIYEGFTPEQAEHGVSSTGL